MDTATVPSRAGAGAPESGTATGLLIIGIGVLIYLNAFARLATCARTGTYAPQILSSGAPAFSAAPRVPPAWKPARRIASRQFSG